MRRSIIRAAVSFNDVPGETVATGVDTISSTRLPPRGLTLIATEPTTAAMSSVEITPTGRSDPGSTTTRRVSSPM